MTDPTLADLTNQVKHLSDLLTTGLVSLGALEATSHPIWTKAECDAECELTGAPCPSKKLVKIHSLKVHPGVQDYLDKLGGWPTEDALCEVEVPPAYLKTPTTTVLTAVTGRKEQKARRDENGKLQWTRVDLDTFTRPKLMGVAKELGIREILKPRGMDYRNEDTEWLRRACISLAEGGRLPRVESKANLAKQPKKSTKKKASKKAKKKTGKKKSGKKAKKKAKRSKKKRKKGK